VVQGGGGGWLGRCHDKAIDAPMMYAGSNADQKISVQILSALETLGSTFFQQRAMCK
jgi:hypothetical protein